MELIICTTVTLYTNSVEVLIRIARVAPRKGLRHTTQYKNLLLFININNSKFLYYLRC